MLITNNVKNTESAQVGKDKNSEQIREDSTSFRKLLEQRKQDFAEKLEKGETQEKFQIGATAFTLKEWKKLILKLDEAIEAIIEGQEEKKEKMEKKEALTEIVG